MKTRFFLLLFALMFASCEKEELHKNGPGDSLAYNKVIVHHADTSGFNIENVSLKIFNGSRNGVTPAPFFYISSLSVDNFWVANQQNPRSHKLFAHSQIDVIYFEKVSNGTIMVQDGSTQVECANYNITIVYTSGNVDELAWYIAPYLGENYVVDPTQSLLHHGSNVRWAYYELTRIDPTPQTLRYRPQNTIIMTRWNRYHETNFIDQDYYFPEDFTSLIWRPKHRL